MPSRPWSKFFWSDWRSDPRLRMCGLAARGLWMEMLAVMHESDPYGYLLVSGMPPNEAQLAILAGTPESQIPALLVELESAGVFSKTRTGVIYSRRMVREDKQRRVNVENGKQGGNPVLKGKKLDRGANPDLVEAVWKKCGGKCTYCGVDMVRNQGAAPNAFEIDHVIPRSKGGTNEFSNLVGACHDCNLSKSDNPAPKPPDKPQKPEARTKKQEGGFAFSGQVVRLKAEHFTRWQRSYPHIAEALTGLLESRDVWLATQPETARKAWFMSTSTWLAAKNAEAAERVKKPGERKPNAPAHGSPEWIKQQKEAGAL